MTPTAGENIGEAALQSLLRRDRAIAATALAALAVLAWAYLVWLAGSMQMGGVTMTGFRMAPVGRGLMIASTVPWSTIEFAFVFAMWLIMMIGMMTPSAAPMILIYARVARQAALDRAPFASTGWFAGGYFLAWSAFSLTATIGQWALDRASLLNASMATTSTVLEAAVLVAAGVYQWTALKDACLAQCQSPLMFLMRHGGFRRGVLSCLRLGLQHGIYCVGCCWALMALLFAGGVMHVLWIAMLASLVLMEKITPFGRWIARTAGATFITAAAWLGLGLIAG